MLNTLYWLKNVTDTVITELWWEAAFLILYEWFIFIEMSKPEHYHTYIILIIIIIYILIVIVWNSIVYAYILIYVLILTGTRSY